MFALLAHLYIEDANEGDAAADPALHPADADDEIQYVPIASAVAVEDGIEMKEKGVIL